MVTSPTGKGVIFSGGFTNRFNGRASNDIYELSGNSLQSLKWTELEQKLNYQRLSHASFLIPNEVSENLLYQYETQKAKVNTNCCTLM